MVHGQSTREDHVLYIQQSKAITNLTHKFSCPYYTSQRPSIFHTYSPTHHQARTIHLHNLSHKLFCIQKKPLKA